MVNRTSWSAVFQEARSKYTPCNYLNAIKTVGQTAAISTLRFVIKLNLSQTWKGSAIGFYLQLNEKSSHLIWAFLRFHRVGIEQANDCALVGLPVLLVDFTKQEKRDALIEVPQVVQPPDTEGPALEQTFPFFSALLQWHWLHPLWLFLLRNYSDFNPSKVNWFRKTHFVTSVEVRYSISSHPCCRFWDS